ncbi:MAG: leucyl aminopeptidase family protein [Myxococcales bacterium]|nr:leucyl aminopeptidase family protein [Myxococcales bacterium]
MPSLDFSNDPATLLDGAHTLVVVARKADLEAGWPVRALPEPVRVAVSRLQTDCKPGAGAAASTLLPEGNGLPRTLQVIALHDKVSRHLSEARSYEIFQHLRALGRPDGGKVAVVVGLASADHALAATLGVTRSFPLYSRKSTSRALEGSVQIGLTTADGFFDLRLAELRAGRDAVQLACRLVDMPTAELDCDTFEREVRTAADGLAHVTVSAITGDELLTAGLRGLHAVGRTAMTAPRLVVLDYAPPEATGSAVALVGKGLVYDTGGLSLKIAGDRMLTMKCDMGGAAAVLGAFQMLVRSGLKRRVIAALAIAENAIGPDSYRPDDVIVMHSGKTMEVNNTDAEGRIALADAASHLARTYAPGILIDAATLTGSQLIATGKWHAGLVSNDGDLEAAALAAGLRSGDHAMPMLFSPELHTGEFKSTVADLRNSVADRNNASASASGLWVWLHIEDCPLRWLHIDLAGPAFLDNRGTGYGVGLMYELVRAL